MCFVGFAVVVVTVSFKSEEREVVEEEEEGGWRKTQSIERVVFVI